MNMYKITIDDGSKYANVVLYRPAETPLDALKDSGYGVSTKKIVIESMNGWVYKPEECTPNTCTLVDATDYEKILIIQ